MDLGQHENYEELWYSVIKQAYRDVMDPLPLNTKSRNYTEAFLAKKSAQRFFKHSKDLYKICSFINVDVSFLLGVLYEKEGFLKALYEKV